MGAIQQDEIQQCNTQVEHKIFTKYYQEYRFVSGPVQDVLRISTVATKKKPAINLLGAVIDGRLPFFNNANGHQNLCTLVHEDKLA
jgi:hypothetical protein